MAMFSDQLRQVVRRLHRAPLFTTITLLTLAIGIGANTVIFSVVEGVLLKPLPYRHPEQLIGVWHTAPGIGIKDLNMSPSVYFIDREQNSTLQDIGAYDGDSLSVTGVGDPEHVRGLDVTDGILPILGVTPALGRLFTRQDDSPGAPETVLLSYEYWQQRFGGASSVIGRAHHGGWQTERNHRRSAEGISFSRSTGCCARTALPVGPQQDETRQLQPTCPCPAKARGHHGAGQCGHGSPASRGHAEFPGAGRLQRKPLRKSAHCPEPPTAEERRCRRCGQRFVGVDGFHRPGAAGGLRECCEPAAGAGRRTPSGTGDPLGLRSRVGTNRRRNCSSRAWCLAWQAA